MELTPIRNIGKNISREYQGAISPSMVKKNDQACNISDGPRTLDEKTKLVSRIYSRPRYHISTLEKLPTEIIGKIFKISLNLSLPRSSAIIGSKLSHWNIYKTLILSAFEVTWVNSFENRKVKKEKKKDKNYAKLQSDILRCRCRWVLKALIVSYQGWIEKTAFTTPKLTYFSPLSKNDSKIQQFNHSFNHDFFDFDFEGFRAITRLRENIPERKDLCWDRIKIVSSEVEIPDWLLLGPWSEEKLKYLFMLIRIGGRVKNWYGKKGETLCVGLRTAVKDGDIGALYLLLWAMKWNSCQGFFELNFDGRNLLTWAIRNVGGDYIAFMCHLITLSHGLISATDKRILLRDFAILENDALLNQDRETLDRLINIKRVSEDLLI